MDKICNESYATSKDGIGIIISSYTEHKFTIEISGNKHQISREEFENLKKQLCVD